MISTAIQQLVNYGLDTGLILPDDEIYIRNQLLMTMQLDDFTAPEGEVCYTDLESILKTLVDDAVARGVCADNSTARDLFDTKLMGVLTPRPSIVRANFEERYENEGPQAATDWFYKFSQDTDYIRRYRIKRDLKWVTKTPYGDLDITINLSKPEKDPKARFIDVEGFMKKFLNNPVKAEKMIQRIYSKALFLKENESPSIAAKILKIMNIMREGEEFYIEESSGVLAALLVEIARLNRVSPEDRVEEETGKLTNMITRVLDFVSYHYMEDIRIEDLAKICHISETHFRRVFTSHMKVSPLEYINSVRIHTACEFLQKTDIPVADIAHKCGFTTNSTFNRNFRQIMGVTPVEWRKRPENYEQQLLDFDIHSEEGW